MQDNMFYTKDHEWIDFQGLIAYVGISNFKLLEFKEIHEIRLMEPLGFARAGEVFAWIGYDDYWVEVHMPVDGWILKVNGVFLANDLAEILGHLEKNGWMVSIAPVSASGRKDLLSSEQYHASIVHIPNS